MEYREIILSVEGSTGILTMNSLKTINVLSKRMIEEIIDVLIKVSVDETFKVVIIRAAGKHFCSGHYLSEMVDSGAKEYKFIFDQCTKIMQLIHEIPQPVIA
jgi:enoyl-CoA hydratase/carnithine racemase